MNWQGSSEDSIKRGLEMGGTYNSTYGGNKKSNISAVYCYSKIDEKAVFNSFCKILSKRPLISTFQFSPVQFNSLFAYMLTQQPKGQL
jgi:hypothetical protein